MAKYYILDAAGEPVEEPDLLRWARWFETAEQHVADDVVGGSRVSTVFLGLNHQWGKGPPVLWETMVFGGPLDEAQDRCCGSRADAAAMHARMVERVKAAPGGQS